MHVVVGNDHRSSTDGGTPIRVERDQVPNYGRALPAVVAALVGKNVEALGVRSLGMQGSRQCFGGDEIAERGVVGPGHQVHVRPPAKGTVVHDQVPHARFDRKGIRHLGFRGVGRNALVTCAKADMLDEDIVGHAANVEAVFPDGDAGRWCGGPRDRQVAIAVAKEDGVLERNCAGDLEYNGSHRSCPSIPSRSEPGPKSLRLVTR